MANENTRQKTRQSRRGAGLRKLLLQKPIIKGFETSRLLENVATIFEQYDGLGHVIQSVVTLSLPSRPKRKTVPSQFAIP